LNNLRVIHLYEADYNLVNKLVWQRGVVWQAHLKGTLNTAESVSRPYHTCIEVVTSKSKKYVYSQLTCTNMTTLDNDAKPCYDRIVASLALIISHHFGVPEETYQTVGETLRTMKFRLRTDMGVSAKYYSHTDASYSDSWGRQGWYSKPSLLATSELRALFDCYQKKAQGMTMTDPTSTINLRQWLEAIVDETSVFTKTPEFEYLPN
jgi:hypothetical protein